MNTWKADALHIHNTVAKRWKAWSEEDRRFLVLAMTGEAGELANLVKKNWRDGDGSLRWAEIRKEIADVRIYLELIAEAYSIDLDKACAAKIPELYRRWPEAENGRPSRAI